jgi:hypothetical protein
MRYATQGQKDAFIAALLDGGFDRREIHPEAIQRAIGESKVLGALLAQMINDEFAPRQILLDLDTPCSLFDEKFTVAPFGHQLDARIRGCCSIDPSKIVLVSANEDLQRGQGPVSFGEFCRVQYQHRLLPPSVASYFIKHPDRLPSDWRGKTIFCWGRLAHNPEAKRIVMGIDCRDGNVQLVRRGYFHDFDINDCSMTLPD